MVDYGYVRMVLDEGGRSLILCIVCIRCCNVYKSRGYVCCWDTEFADDREMGCWVVVEWWMPPLLYYGDSTHTRLLWQFHAICIYESIHIGSWWTFYLVMVLVFVVIGVCGIDRNVQMYRE
jgi:hypothetical protein